MTNQTSSQQTTAADGVSPSLRALGTRSWLYLGIVLWAVAIIAFLSTISGVFVPLVVAVTIAMLFYPLVDGLEARRVNRTIGGLLVMLLVIAVLIGTLWVVLVGIFSQMDEILIHIQAGLVSLADKANVNLPAGLAEQIRVKALQALPQLASGIASFTFSGVSGIMALGMGIFTAFFLLFYLLSDWHGVSDWVSRHLGVPGELGLSLVADAASAMRIYFYALTLANLPVAAVVGITMWLLGLPLAVPVALVTLVTSYIPYLGAFLSSAVAALVALGAGGVTDAIIIIVVIVALQNILDPVIANYVTSDKLEMHPIVTLVTTLAGGILFGALGAMLANPVTAMLINARARLQAYHAEQQTGGDQKAVAEVMSEDDWYCKEGTN